MNMLKLNKPQRILLAIFGLLILFFQLSKFDTDGIEGTGWVIAIVAASLLLLPAFSIFSKRSNEPLHKGIQECDNFLAQHSKTQSIFEKSKVKALELQEAMISWLNIPDLPGFAQINSMMKDLWLQYCLAYVVSLASAVEFKKNSVFFQSNEFKILWAQTVKHMASISENSAQQNGLSEKFDSESAELCAFRDLKEAKAATQTFIDALASKSPEPDAALIEYMVKKIGVPDALKEHFVSNFRSFTKELLLEFSAK